MIKKIFFHIICIYFFLLSNSLFAQEQGKFNIRNYSPKEYSAFVQNWAVVQDNRGVMYFANGDGVLRYDGSDWQLIKIPNSSAVRSIAKNSAGDIFVGAIGDFGYLKNGEKGKSEFFSLNGLLDERDRENLEIWFTKTVNDDVYFCALRAVYRYHNGQIEVFKTADDIISCFVFKDQIYIYEYKAGIKKFTDKGFVLTSNGEYFKDKPFRFVVEYDSSKLIVGTYNGLSLLDMDSFNSSSATPFFSWFKTDFDNTIRNSFPYHGIRLKNGDFALCLLPYGLVIIDKNGKTKNFFNKVMGLQTESVTNVFEDFENNLWLTLAKGISKIEYSSPFNFWIEKDSFELVNDIVRHKNKLYIGCLNGLFALEGNKIKVVNNYRSPVFSLLKFKNPNFNDEILLIGTEFNGLISIEKDKLRPLVNTNSVIYTIFQSKKDPSLLYIGLSGSLMVARFKNNGFEVIGDIEGVTKEVRKIVEQSDGTLWCSNQTNYTLQIIPSENPIKPKSLKEFTSKEGIIGYQSLACYNDKILIGTNSGIYCLNEARDKFIPYSSFGKEYGDGTFNGITLLQIDNLGDLWIQGIRNKHYGLGIKNAKGAYVWYQTPFNALPESSSPLTYIESDTTIWIATNDEIYRFKGDFNRAFPLFKTIIKTVSIGKDSLIYSDGESLNQQLIKKVAYKNNSITFVSGAFTYYDEKSTSYQTFLEGFDAGWSNWTKDPKREFTNLPEGAYKFRTKAKNIYDKIGDEAVFEFIILTPWYRSILAYTLYLVILIGIVILVIRIYTRNLKVANIKLERIVDQRTIEIQKQRDELLILNSTKDKFFGIIAHDLRNPFNSILGFSELILDRLKKEDVKSSLVFMQNLHKTSMAAYELLDNLLTWSRSQSGDIQFKPETLNIKKQIDYTIIMLEGAAHIKGIKMSSNLTKIFFVYADINMVLTILRNLLTNAIKFSNEGDSVTIDAKESNNEIIISVTDTGIGISESMIKKLFRVDEHVKTEGTASEAGTGLGLILCKEFVEKNSGKIWVESTVGRGSCFSFSLQKEIG